MPDHRFGVYYLPPEGSALAAFGASWLGWDVAAGQAVAHPDVAAEAGADAPLDVAAVTATPRIYGFHGTMKPPFRLAEGSESQGAGERQGAGESQGAGEALERALAELGARHAAFDAPPLRLARLGAFLALVPSAPCPALADLAAECVQALDPFRAPASAAELARRRAAGLSARQDEMLVRWGYPYVLDEFRFHLTLTGRLDPATADTAERVLAGLTAPLTREPMPVREICLVEQVDGAPFRLVHRYPLTG